jgi:hypothetical protein
MSERETIDLTQSADVLWISVDKIPPHGIGGGQKRHFTTLRDALIFIMVELTGSRQGDSVDNTSWQRFAGDK